MIRQAADSAAGHASSRGPFDFETLDHVVGMLTLTPFAADEPKGCCAACWKMAHRTAYSSFAHASPFAEPGLVKTQPGLPVETHHPSEEFQVFVLEVGEIVAPASDADGLVKNLVALLDEIQYHLSDQVPSSVLACEATVDPDLNAEAAQKSSVVLVETCSVDVSRIVYAGV